MKRSKRPKHRATGESVDLISRLPDCILSHILSLLPTRDAFRTTLLYSRWKFLFASNPSLDFQGPPPGVRLRERQRFVDFVNKVVVFRKSGLTRFRLRIGFEHVAAHLNLWIKAAVFRNAQQLHLQVHLKESRALPSDLFKCRTLVDLRLQEEFELEPPSSACLPRLRVLHLKSGRFRGHDSFSELLNASHVLEQLHLSHVGFGVRRMGVLKIATPTVRRLMSYCSDCDDDEVSLHAPSLLYAESNCAAVRAAMSLNPKLPVVGCESKSSSQLRCTIKMIFNTQPPNCF